MSRPQPLHESNSWYVVRVRPNSEWKTTASLMARGFEVFLPCFHRVRERARRRVVEAPLFPGYLFCRFDRCNLVPIISAAGVIQVLSRGQKPEPVKESEVFALRSVARSNLALEPWPRFETGQKIRILYGPLAGVEGIVLRDTSKPRLVISVSLLHRSVVANIDRECLEHLPLKKGDFDLQPPYRPNSVEPGILNAV